MRSAFQSAPSTASSVASTVAREQRVELVGHAGGPAPARRAAPRGEREEDLAAAVVGDRPGAGKPEPGAAGQAGELARGRAGHRWPPRRCSCPPASRARHRIRRPAAAPPARRPPAGRARDAEVGQHAARPPRAPRRRSGWPCRSRPSSSKQIIPVPAPTAPWTTSPRRARPPAPGPRRPPRPAPRARRSASCRRTRPRPGSPRRRRPPRVGGHGGRHRAVVDAADGHGRGQVDRRLEHAPLADVQRPVISPAPLSTATPAGDRRGRRACRSAGTIAVTPVRATPRPAGGSGSSRTTVTWPTRTRPRRRSSRRGRARARRCEPVVAQAAGGLHAARDPTSRIRSRAMGLAMPVVWSDRHRLHDPGGEVWVGVRTPGTELPERAERIRERARGGRGAARGTPRRSPTTALPACTTPTFVDYLASAWDDWERAGPDRGSRPGPRGALPVRARRPRRRRPAAAGRRERAGRPVRLRHHDPDRPRHLGGGARGARRRGYRGRPRARRARPPRTPAAARPATT